MRFVLAELTPLLAIILVPLSVHAGVFSTVLQIFGADHSATSHGAVIENTFTDIKLLSATTNPDPTGAQGGGDVLIQDGSLVATGTLGEDEMAAAKTFTGEISVYVVREGDALSQIAEMYGVTANTILWANDLKSSKDIHPGQSLVILPVAGVRHVVKSGDTLAAIVKKYDADLDEVLAYNHLESGATLTEGATIVVPGGTITVPKTTAVASRGGSTAGAASGGGGGFVHPAPGAVRTQGIHGYNGVDLAGNYGSAIRAAAAGEVIVSKSGGWNGGYGNYVVIRHASGAQTLYAHMSTVSVGVGAYVSAGETIGGMGSTGRSTGTHLHFEVRGARNPF